MKLHSSITINDKTYAAGDTIEWYRIYPFFALHIFMFGLGGVVFAYSDKSSLLFLYLTNGIAITLYVVGYIAIFGPDRVKWMFINAALGFFGIWTQIDWLLSLFGKNAADYPPSRHAIPFLYFILYTFLLHNAVLDITQSRDNPRRMNIVDIAYIVISVAVYGISYFVGKV